jgi:hypothetical protein
MSSLLTATIEGLIRTRPSHIRIPALLQRPSPATRLAAQRLRKARTLPDLGIAGPLPRQHSSTACSRPRQCAAQEEERRHDSKQYRPGQCVGILQKP